MLPTVTWATLTTIEYGENFVGSGIKEAQNQIIIIIFPVSLINITFVKETVIFQLPNEEM